MVVFDEGLGTDYKMYSDSAGYPQGKGQLLLAFRFRPIKIHRTPPKKF